MKVNDAWIAKAEEPRVTSESIGADRWWESFNDASLNRLVELGYAENLPIQVTGLRIAEARARLGVAAGRGWPELFASGGATAVGLSRNAANVTGFQRNYFTAQAGFDAAWEVDLWGKYRKGVEAETALMSASVADFDAALVSLAAEIARTYALVRTYEVLIAQAIENVRIQEEGYNIADSRFKNGATSELDVSQASGLLESTRATIPHLQISLQEARNALSTLIGQPSGHLDELLAGPKEIPVPPASVPLGVPAELLRRRPDIRSAEHLAAAQAARIGAAESHLFPTLMLNGSVGLMASNASGTDFDPANALYYSVGPDVVWPLLDWGQRVNVVRIEDARYQQSLVNIQETVLRAAQEVEDALAGYQLNAQASAFEEKSVVAARRSVEIAIIEYREGANDYQRVLDAQRSLLDQQRKHAETRSLVATNLIALYKALGGGWESRAVDPIPAATREQMEQRVPWGDDLPTPRPPSDTSPRVR